MKRSTVCWVFWKNCYELFASYKFFRKITTRSWILNIPWFQARKVIDEYINNLPWPFTFSHSKFWIDPRSIPFFCYSTFTSSTRARELYSAWSHTHVSFSQSLPFELDIIHQIRYRNVEFILEVKRLFSRNTIEKKTKRIVVIRERWRGGTFDC